MKKLFFFMACLLASTTMFAETYTWTAAKASDIPAAKSQTLTLNEVAWTMTRAEGSTSNFNQEKGAQIGTSDKPETSFQLTTSAFSSYSISSITINASMAKDGDAKYSIKIGETELGSGNLTTTPTDYTVNNATATGNVTISLTCSKKAMYLKSITIVYTEETDPTAPVISANTELLDFGKYNAAEAPAERTLTITAKNISDEGLLVDMAEGWDYFDYSGDEELTTEGGELTITCIATEAGVYEGVLYVTDGTTELEVALKAELFALAGDGTKDNPYTVADVINLNNTKADSCWVTGYILGARDNNNIVATKTESNIVLADANEEGATQIDATKHIAVQLSSDTPARDALKITNEPTTIGKKVKVHGKLEAYFSTSPGVKGTKRVDQYEIIGGTTALENAGAETIKARKVVENGQIIIIRDGVRFNVLGAQL